MRKLISLMLSLCLLLTTAAFGLAEPAAETGVFPAIAGENGTTYVSLFDVIISDRWTPVWQDYIAAVLGEDAAPDMTTRLQSSITSDLYGEAAVAAFVDGGYAFDCDFINGAESITFNGSTATILKTDGTSETHTYEYLGKYNVGGTETMMYQGTEISMAFPVDVYKSTDEAGEFNYFFLREDTMAETYHIEFRYGRDLEELQGYLVGPYAYWLAAGIDADADEETIRKVIALFCLENMDYSAHTDAALNQLADLGFVGSWKADLSAYGEDYAAVDLSMSIDANGHGVTTMNGAQTADFEAYAADSGEKGDGQGLYVAYSNLESEAESAPYTMTVNEAGQSVLTFIADDGTISWIKQDAETDSEVIEIGTAEELAAMNGNLSGRYVLTADIDLAGIDWTPIGAFLPGGGEEGEVPDMTAAFTGTFDGQGHTICNLTVNQPEAWAMGLFGCIANAEVGNFTLENAAVDGMMMSADVVGYSYCSTVSGIKLVNSRVTAHYAEMGAERMFGGIAGAGMGSLITGCEVQADIVIPDGTANAGLVGGGLEMTSVVNCTATGSVTAGSNCYGIGGISGCGFVAEQFTDLTAQNVILTVGDNCRWIGGITGYAGGYPAEELGMPVTVFTNCRALNVTVNAGADADGIGDIVGSGFFSEALAVNGAPFDQPTRFELVNCAAE
ncbi:MAG: hypothetical protein IKH38_04920 [Clostridia bacterium]|nr:hypothetical protein [Clostridia bacterium]